MKAQQRRLENACFTFDLTQGVGEVNAKGVDTEVNVGEVNTWQLHDADITGAEREAQRWLHAGFRGITSDFGDPEAMPGYLDDPIRLQNCTETAAGARPDIRR